MAVVERGKVCVTGAGGFLASWVVDLLLSKDYFVHGTVRDPENEKYAHLKKLEKAGDKLKLFKADLLDYFWLQRSLSCRKPGSLIFSTKSGELVAPAVDGTLNVLKACIEAKVKRVVYVSSVAELLMNPLWSKNQVLDETWNIVEKLRIGIVRQRHKQKVKLSNLQRIDLVSICPTMVFGPVLQQHTRVLNHGRTKCDLL